MSYELRNSAVISLNRALLGEVSANLRAVEFLIKDTTFTVRFSFYDQPDDNDRDSVNVVTGHLAGDFPDYQVYDQIAVVDEGKRSSRSNWLAVYLRR